MKTTVVHCRRESYDVYIGRPSIFGNPFKIGPGGTRAEVIEKYRAWVLEKPALVEEIRWQLRGKRLGCYCAPQPCHGDVLAEIADSDESAHG